MEKWLEQRTDGWWVFEVGGGWSDRHGPYRSKLWAMFVYVTL
jgi:hypothetical protein